MSSTRIDIDLPSGERMPAYLARPDGEATGMGVVLLQEIFGINANMRGVADDYATRGIVAIVPDLFWRQEPGVELDPSNAADRDRATELMKGLDQPQAVDDSLAAAQYLRTIEGGPAKVGAVGYCLGGKLAFLMATCPGVDAAVSYYGVAIQASLEKAHELQSPLLLHIAGEDHLCPPEAQARIKETFAPIADVTIMDYPGVGHAFARRGGHGYDAASAERADNATAAFLQKHLGSAG
ncbi:dienelactone hydrolase family protein [Sphingomonas sp.]|uniref:dienelactone hydrolase family protein n=1 Tax=Sphingomonas sp. TaxID=28214 RepID=UPI0035BC9289